MTLSKIAQAKALAASINKDLKQADLVVMGSDISYDGWPRASSGSLGLDYALGGGWPLNVWNEVVGEKSAGKTMCIYKTIAAQQRLDPTYLVFWVAAEDFVPEYAEKLGCDVERFVVFGSNVMESAYQAIIKVLTERVFDCVVIDSLPALVPSSEDEKTMDERTVGLGALLTGQFFRKQRPAIKRSMVDEEAPVLAFMVNQYREKIGVMYGDNRTTPGGKAKDYHYFTQTEVRRKDWIEEPGITDKVRVGQTVAFRILKNKTHPPQKVAEVDFYFDKSQHGLLPGDYDSLKEIVGLSLALEVVERRGKFYQVSGHEDLGKWEGRENFVNAVRQDPSLADLISAEVLTLATKRPMEHKVHKVQRPK